MSPPERIPDSSRELADLARNVARTFLSYVRGQVIVALIISVVYAIGFEWADVPWWGLIALICGLFHLIPMVGSFLAALIPIVTALAAGGDFRQVLHIVGVFVVVQILENFYLTPKILGRELRVSPVLVFLAVLLGGLTFGVLGAFLAPPLAAVALLLWRQTRRQESQQQNETGGYPPS